MLEGTVIDANLTSQIQSTSIQKMAALSENRFSQLFIHKKYPFLKSQKILKKLVEYKPIGNYKSYKNTCHSGRRKKGLLMRPERNEKYIRTNK